MYIYQSVEKVYSPNGTAVALGYFDGVHMGHRAVINAAAGYAKKQNLATAVFTFELGSGAEKQPSETGHTSTAQTGDIFSIEERFLRIASLEVEHCLCPKADTFYGKTPGWFVEEVLEGAFGAKAVFCGEDFTFGKNREGTVGVLKSLCAARGIAVHVVESAFYKGEKVSATRLRACLANGEIELANTMLCQPYSVDFVVQPGKQLGRTIGRPTINQVYPAGILQPLQGVYAAKVELEGKVYAAATGFGTRPTVNTDNLAASTMETYIKNFSGDLYGKKVRTELLCYLWPTKKYENLQELADMIENAAKRAEDIILSGR